MTVLLAALLAFATSADSMVVLLNSPSSCSSNVYVRARAQVEREARMGLPLQQFVIGVTQPDNPDSPVYLASARPRIERQAKVKNNSMAWYLLAVADDDRQALERAAAGGNVQALNALGTILTNEALADANLTSNEVEKALNRSYLCFGKAAADRDPNGFVNLGTCYLHGLGCRQDYLMAFNCFRSAAEMGHPEAMDYLSAAYQLGHGTEPNVELSLFWQMKAKALRGNEAAAKWLWDYKTAD